MKVQFQKKTSNRCQFSGAIHEHMRWDRDNHIKINFENLQTNQSERNFGVKSLDTYVTYGTPFDWHIWPDAIFTRRREVLPVRLTSPFPLPLSDYFNLSIDICKGLLSQYVLSHNFDIIVSSLDELCALYWKTLRVPHALRETSIWTGV